MTTSARTRTGRSTTPSRSAQQPPRRRRVGPLVVANEPGGIARGALHVAELLARRDRVNAHVVGLLRPVELPRWVLDATDAKALQDGLQWERRRHLRRQIHETVGRSIFFSTEVLVGDSMQAIRDAVLATDAEYVLVGLDGPSAPDRIRSERFALQLARVVGRPVMAMPPACTTLPLRAVVAVDDDPGSERAALAAARVLAPGGTLTLATPARDAGDVAGLDVDDRVARVASALQVVPGITVETATLPGEPAALLEFAAERECDLVACALRGRAAGRGTRTSTIPPALLGRATTALLVAPPSR